jgi:hypothetical protein
MDMEIDEIQNKLTKADDREIEAMEVVDIVVCFHNALIKVHASYFRGLLCYAIFSFSLIVNLILYFIYLTRNGYEWF